MSQRGPFRLFQVSGWTSAPVQGDFDQNEDSAIALEAPSKERLSDSSCTLYSVVARGLRVRVVRGLFKNVRSKPEGDHIIDSHPPKRHNGEVEFEATSESQRSRTLRRLPSRRNIAATLRDLYWK